MMIRVRLASLSRSTLVLLRAGALFGAARPREDPRDRRALADDGGAVKTISLSQFIFFPKPRTLPRAPVSIGYADIQAVPSANKVKGLRAVQMLIIKILRRT
mgnify:CR=1 FL=1|jgi:hypothetical protein